MIGTRIKKFPMGMWLYLSVGFGIDILAFSHLPVSFFG
jgi:hypothetical protein